MEQQISLATREKRLVGAIIDGLLSTVIMAPILFVTGKLQQLFNNKPMTFSEQLIFISISLLISTLLHGYLLYDRGQTIGKVVAKTKIVDLEGNKPKISTLLGLRYYLLWFLSFIPLLGHVLALINALFIFRKDHRCLHDHLAGTQVVDL